MLGKYKVIKDFVPNATQVLMEVCDMINVCTNIVDALVPYKRSEGSLAKFLTQRTNKLKKLVTSEFESIYSAVSGVLVNGLGDSAPRNRLAQAIYRYRELNKGILECKCVVKSDADSGRYRALASSTVGDLAVYVILQYKLYVDDGTVTMAIEDICNKSNVTPDVFYGTMLALMEESGAKFYVYEEASNLYGAMTYQFEALLNEAEENRWEFTEDMAQSLLDGEISLQECRRKLSVQVEVMEERKDINFKTLVQNMNISGR